MSTAKPRKNSTRGAPRKRPNGDGAPAADSSVGDVTAFDAATERDRQITNSPIVDSRDVDGPAADHPTDEAEHEIRIRAYELYLSRGSVDGDDLSDWLEAERLVRSSRPGIGNGDGENRSNSPA